MVKRLFDFKQELMVWGSHDVIKALYLYEKKFYDLESNKNSNESILIVDDLLREIRKDLGHNDTAMKRGQLVSMLVKVPDREEIISNSLEMDA